MLTLGLERLHWKLLNNHNHPLMIQLTSHIRLRWFISKDNRNLMTGMENATFFVDFLYDCQSAWKGQKIQGLLLRLPIEIFFFSKLFLVFGFIEWVLSTPQNSFQGGVLFNHFSSVFHAALAVQIKKIEEIQLKILKYFSCDFV